MITSWSYQAAAVDPATSVQLKIGTIPPGADLTGDVNVTIVAQSAVESPVAGLVNTFDSRIPVEPGYRIGEYVDGGDGGCSRQDPSYTDHFLGDDVAPGSTELFSTENFQQDISAVLEPDADGDGYGDETQDECPKDASTQGACADTDPPETTITKDPPKRTEKNKVKFKFSSDEPGSTFECKKDRKPWRPCTSPTMMRRLDEGKHRFKVRATDAAGNTDRTPDKDKFKVVD